MENRPSLKRGLVSRHPDMARILIPRGGNDQIMTPDYLAEQIVDHFSPVGSILEPCRGGGAFTRAFPSVYPTTVDWCEVRDGRDFLTYDLPHFDWVITNPPFSQFRAFLKRSMQVADNVVFLSLVNAWFMKARLRDIKEAGFGFREIAFVKTPSKETGWPQFGIQLGATYIRRNYSGPVTFSSL